MEWVEVTGKTVEEAKEAALDQLGVDEEDAEFEVVEEPKAGLFGRLRSEARVRARVMPSVPRPKLDRRDRRRSSRSRDGGGSGSSGTEAAAGGGAGGGGRSGGGRRGRKRDQDEGEQGVSDERDDSRDGDEHGDEHGDEGAVEVAESFLRGLLDALGAPQATIAERPLEEDLVELSVQGEGLGLLIGPRGQTLGAVQELARTVVQRRSRERSGRIIVDIGGYREVRRGALERFAGEAAAQALETGAPVRLEAMPPADRKVVHDAINGIDGVTTSSEGEEPRRRVVISPAPKI